MSQPKKFLRDPSQVQKELEKASVILKGHFVLKSGRHSDVFVDMERLYPQTSVLLRITRTLASKFIGQGIRAVIGPGKGGMMLAQWVAAHLLEADGHEVYALYAERDTEGKLTMRQDMVCLLQGNHALLVDDVVTKGTTIRELVELVHENRGIIAGAGVIYNRGQATAKDLNVQNLTSLLEFDLPNHIEEECPECMNEVPINIEVGHGREFLEQKSKMRKLHSIVDKHQT